MTGLKKSEKEEVYEWLCRIGQQFNSAFVITDPNLPNQPVQFANAAFTDITGYQAHEIYGEEQLLLIGKNIEQEMVAQLNDSLQMEAVAKFELLQYKKDKSPFWNDMYVQSIHSQKGEHLYNVIIFTDNTLYKQQEMIIKLEQEIYEGIEKGFPVNQLLQKICDMAEQFFPQGAMCSILQIVDEEVMAVAATSLPFDYHLIMDSLNINEYQGPCGVVALTKEKVIVENIADSEQWQQSLREAAKKHQLTSCWSFPVTTHTNEVVATFNVYFHDRRTPSELELAFIEKITPIVLLTLKTAEYKDKIKHLAYQDTLSGLPNYNYFIDHFLEKITKQSKGFVLLIQPSEYGNIVDSYGKKQLASFQVQMHRRIQALLTDMDTLIARSSEASLIVAGTCSEEDIPYYIQLLLETTKEPFILNGIELFISVKMGIVSLNYFDGDVDNIVRLADVAMSRAKKQAGNSIVFYKEEFSQQLNEKINVQNALIRALKNNELYIELQPKINTETEQIISFEALARWYSPTLGQVSPAIFIQAAETIGKIQDIDFIVIEQVLQWLQNRKLNQQKLYQVSVNISPAHFYASDFIEKLHAVVLHYEIEPKYLKIELTENVSLFDLNQAEQILQQLHENGFESSVDDFGIGFSSLSYLHRLPLSEVKIDRSFIQNIHEKGGKILVETIIQLANNMGMKTVAEGVETKEQLLALKSMGCLIVQGYYFYKPISISEVDKLLLTRQHCLKAF